MVIGKDRISAEALYRASVGEEKVELCREQAFVEKIDAGARFLDEALKKHGGIYGVTTGYGDSCTEIVDPEHYYDLPLNLSRYHGCGLGNYFDEQFTRAIMIVRLNTLAQGYSGVSFELLSRIHFLIENDILPLIPEEGSVGASGDLTPLSYIAGTLAGERDVLYKGTVQPSGDVLSGLGIEPYRFRPKEAIAIMNGTAVMNAVAAIAFIRSYYLADLACRTTAMASFALHGNVYHFSKRLFEVKPHRGQALAAQKILGALGGAEKNTKDIIPERIQDPYSIRCAPHIIGVFYDVKDTLRTIIETEMNSANDNPIIDPETESIYHGGHFYGGHICFASDSLKNIVANLADLADRQLALLVDKKFSRGLPPNLSGTKKSFSYNHGFKAVQIGASAWAAEALKNTMPASVFSRSTECHNQDKVSMGTIAARDCIRVIKLTSQVYAASLLACAQALHLRLESGDISRADMDGASGVATLYDEISGEWEFLEDDRPLESDLRNILALIEGFRFNV